ncbi:MAG: glycosyltransferase family 4 protein [Acidobacteriaceae bacterium]
MRVLHLISSGGMYGAEAVILNLSRTLNQQGHASIVGVFSNASNPNLQLHELALAESIESHQIPCHGQIDRSVPSAIRSLAASVQAEVIHAHGYKADVYAWLAMRGSDSQRRIPLVSTCHTWYDDNPLVWLYGALDRKVLRSYQAVIAVSDNVRTRLLAAGVSADQIHFIRNGIDLRPFNNAKNRPPTFVGALTPTADPTTGSTADGAPDSEELLVGWVGRLTRDKGPDLFLRAIAQLRTRFPATRYIMVGEGPYRPECERLIAELAAGDLVQLLGQRSDMPAIFASCDLMVSSSRLEGLPMAILEGMAASLPWVATSVGAVPLAIRDGENGLLIPPENVDLLAASMARLMLHPEERARMGAAARTLAEQEFSAERMTEDTLKVYEQARLHRLLDRPRPRSLNSSQDHRSHREEP